MNIEIFFFLVYRQLFTFALLKTTRPPRSLFLTIVILNLYLISIWEEFNNNNNNNNNNVGNINNIKLVHPTLSFYTEQRWLPSHNAVVIPITFPSSLSSRARIPVFSA